MTKLYSIKRSYIGGIMNNKLSGFTLAEVLITLGVIGVVAAMTMPMLITNLNERINSERQANIAQKITQAMEQMRAHGLLNTQYASTDAFVDELQKYLKVAKRCNASNIADCWPTATVTAANGEEYDVSDAKLGKNINNRGLGNQTNNVGLVLADGASLIMTYNTNASGIDVGDPVTATKKDLPIGRNGKTKEFPYTTSVTGSIDFVMDVNGAKGPNKEKSNKTSSLGSGGSGAGEITITNYDIRSFKSASFSKSCEFKIGSMCVVNLGTSYSAVNCSSSNSSSSDYTTYCGSYPSEYTNDYWAGANKACKDIGMTLASRSELRDIYDQKGESGVPTSGWFWSSAEYNSYYAWDKSFDNGYENNYTKINHFGALCVGN